MRMDLRRAVPRTFEEMADGALAGPGSTGFDAGMLLLRLVVGWTLVAHGAQTLLGSTGLLACRSPAGAGGWVPRSLRSSPPRSSSPSAGSPAGRLTRSSFARSLVGHVALR